MRLEQQNGHKILCGHILKDEQVKPGQRWLAFGAKIPVTITAVKDGRVTYESPIQPSHEKSIWDFQCRYCLVLEPGNLLNL